MYRLQSYKLFLQRADVYICIKYNEIIVLFFKRRRNKDAKHGVKKKPPFLANMWFFLNKYQGRSSKTGQRLRLQSGKQTFLNFRFQKLQLSFPPSLSLSLSLVSNNMAGRRLFSWRKDITGCKPTEIKKEKNNKSCEVAVFNDAIICASNFY